MSQALDRNTRIFVAVLLAAVIVSALAGLYWARSHNKDLSEFTRESGLPLTSEQQSVDFTHADLSFVIHPERRSIEGRAVLDLLVRKPISKIQFDLDRNLPVSRVSLNGSELGTDRWSNREGRAVVLLPRQFNPGDKLQLAIEYSGRPQVAEKPPWDGGFVWSETEDGKPWIATAVEGEGCDLFWPCFDNSRVEVGTIDLHIDVPKGLAAPANGRLLSVERLGGGRTRWNWRAKHPNNYAIALDVAPFRLKQSVYRSRFGNSFPVQYWHLPGDEAKASALLAEMVQTIDFFEATIGPYPFGDEKVGVVETPHFGMEHQTINAYGNKYKVAPEGYDWLLNHEFSHEWFGNQLTNGDWDDMWLHEGFGSYMQPLTLGWLRGRMVYDAAMFKQRQQIHNKHPIVTGRHRSEDEVSDPAKGPATDIYYKGSWVLHTLRGLIGEEAFWRATRRLVYGRPDPKPGNFRPRFGSTNEFIALAEQESGRKLGWFFDIYLRQAAIPKLAVTRTGHTLRLQWKTPGGRPFPMPVEVLIDGERTTVPMTNGRGTVPLPAPNALVTVDPDGAILRQSDEIDRFRDDPEATKPYGTG